MSHSAKTIFLYGIYLVLFGAGLILIPNLLLALFGFPATEEVWIRVVGVLVLILGYFYIQSARHGQRHFYRLTVHGRLLVFTTFTLFVLLDMVSPTLLLIGMVDLAGAYWTWHALRTAPTT